MATGFELRHENDVLGLAWVHRFGWLRSAELGRLMWPAEKHARTRTDRVIRGWLERKLVIARTLPNGARRAVVLSEAGARLLQEAGTESARSGKDWGETEGTRWSPNLTWQHDLIAAGVLVRLYEAGYDIKPEKMLRRENPALVKIPDGLAWKDGHVIWLEVESARKTGPAMRFLADAIRTVANGQSPQVSGQRPNEVMVAYVKEAKDERGHCLDHQQRVVAAIKNTSPQDVQLTWAPCVLAGCGVATMNFQQGRITADRTSRILKILDARRWREDENGCFEANYRGIKAIVWEEEHMGWAYVLEEEGASNNARIADNKTAAMRGCADWLAAR